jgi:broad specificity phosphatase PhoE
LAIADLVHLVRHAEVRNPDGVVYGRLPGFALSDIGRAQAAACALWLRSRPVSAVWSSPLQRALETALVIADEHRISVRVDAALTEWFMADAWEGVAWSELPSARPGELEAYLTVPAELPFSSESLEQLARRVGGAVAELERNHPGGELVVVGHQDPTQAARLWLTGRPLTGLHEDKPGHASIITLRPGDPWVEVDVRQ